ncbi:MAG TPA: DNA-binding domain-containing protein [Symbiobacteriaceae bacterium]|nr:DNA-binding domain-containing protein [Symbiobacteriaceae bacterium]
MPQPYRIVIVDDDPAVVRMLQRIVEEHGLGVVVERAGDGPSGESVILQHRPDIVLIDLLMPGQDGLETIRRLRQQGFQGAFVMISQVNDKDLVARAYKVGVEFFIYKPLNLTEILAVLHRVAETVQMRQTLQHIRASLAPIAAPEAAPAPAPAARGAAGETEIRRAGRRVLADLGILGEAGGAELVAIALLPEFREGQFSGDLDLAGLYNALMEQYQAEGVRVPGAKAIEQRLRRAASAALSHLAALGLEDYADPRFERLAPTFFGFTEVRTEMTKLRSGSGAPGRINLKKFIVAFLHEIESAVREEE